MKELEDAETPSSEFKSAILDAHALTREFIDVRAYDMYQMRDTKPDQVRSAFQPEDCGHHLDNMPANKKEPVFDYARSFAQNCIDGLHNDLMALLKDHTHLPSDEAVAQCIRNAQSVLVGEESPAAKLLCKQGIDYFTEHLAQDMGKKPEIRTL